MSDFTMIQNGSVEVVKSLNAKNFPIATITVNDKHIHQFDANSRISKALDFMSEKELTTRLNGGSYFFIGDNLVDFRDNQYNGFVHSEEAIGKLIEVIGFVQGKDIKKAHFDNSIAKNISLSTVWNKTPFQVPAYHVGGEFNSILRFMWNPFIKDVHTQFEILRLICLNGMTAMSSFMNSKIPLVNRWEEHLDIASRQIQHKVESKVSARMGEMGSIRASIADCQLVLEHANHRLVDNSYNIEQAKRDRLNNIKHIVAPEIHLGDKYFESVFEDKRVASQMPSHLSLFDVYNMVTEIGTHTDASENSSKLALDKFGTHLVFDRADISRKAARYEAPLLSAFSDPDAAFFGEMV